MSRYLVGCLTVALSFLPASLAIADPPLANQGAVYDTIDAIQAVGNIITITGIISGQSTPSELRYPIYNDGLGTASIDGAARCDRFALLAIAKPGKYQFAAVRLSDTGFRFGCKLIVRAP